MIKIIKAQITTDLKELAKDFEAGLHDSQGVIKALISIRTKVLDLEAHEDAVSDIEDNEPEMRAERMATEECDCHASPEDGCKCSNEL